MSLVSWEPVTLPPPTAPPPPNATQLIEAPGTGTTEDILLWAGLLLLGFVISVAVLALFCRRLIKQTSDRERERRRLQRTRQGTELEEKFRKIRGDLDDQQQQLEAALNGEAKEGPKEATKADAAKALPADKEADHQGISRDEAEMAQRKRNMRAAMRAADALAWTGEAPTRIGDDSDNDSDVAFAAVCDLPVVHEHASTLFDPPELENTFKYDRSISARFRSGGGPSADASGLYGETWNRSTSMRLKRASMNPFLSKRETFFRSNVPEVDGDGHEFDGSLLGHTSIDVLDGADSAAPRSLDEVLMRLKVAAPAARHQLVDTSASVTASPSRGKAALPTASLPWMAVNSLLEKQRRAGSGSRSPDQTNLTGSALVDTHESPERRLRVAAERTCAARSASVGRRKTESHADADEDEDDMRPPRVVNTRTAIERIIKREDALPLPDYL